MTGIVEILVYVAIFATVAALVIGIGGFGAGGKFNTKHGNRMMRLRILFQAIAVILILLLVYLNSGG
ncbi:MAG TPA: twin transmembrane helix small protein [Rhodobacteraceae bacterium]|nr:twin transmembrane helix small protein [Paracoccaceae bacterium]